MSTRDLNKAFLTLTINKIEDYDTQAKEYLERDDFVDKYEKGIATKDFKLKE